MTDAVRVGESNAVVPPAPPLIFPTLQFKNIPKEVEVDMSKPEEGRMSRAGQVLVDLSTKRVY